MKKHIINKQSEVSFERRFREWIWPILASNSDTPLVCAARNLVHWLTELLHAENHDFRTNGEVRLLECLGSTATVILDVGANQGEWALEAYHCCPNAKIYCSEISSKTREKLRENVANAERITVLNFGFSDHIGKEKVKYYPDRNVVTSIYDFPHPNHSIWTEEEVQTGDRFVKDNGLEHIDLLKIDAEGSDFRVLEGFEKTLTLGAISVLQFEYGYASILSRKLLIDFYEYLEPKGYVVGKLHSKSVDFCPYRFVDENFFGPNFIAVHRNYQYFISQLANI